MMDQPPNPLPQPGLQGKPFPIKRFKTGGSDRLDVTLDGSAARLLHVVGKAFLDPFPDPAVPGPGKPETVKDLAELRIFHEPILASQVNHDKRRCEPESSARLTQGVRR